MTLGTIVLIGSKGISKYSLLCLQLPWWAIKMLIKNNPKLKQSEGYEIMHSYVLLYRQLIRSASKECLARRIKFKSSQKFTVEIYSVNDHNPPWINKISSFYCNFILRHLFSKALDNHRKSLNSFLTIG